MDMAPAVRTKRVRLPEIVGRWSTRETALVRVDAGADSLGDRFIAVRVTSEPTGHGLVGALHRLLYPR
jgi:hypothetical protein